MFGQQPTVDGLLDFERGAFIKFSISRRFTFAYRCISHKVPKPEWWIWWRPRPNTTLGHNVWAVNALCIIGTTSAYNAIDKTSLLRFLYAVRDDESGAFRMHVDGEIDVRGAYCAVAVAKLVNITHEVEEKLFRSTVDWIVLCQTYEGGMGGVPYQEAHGGYTFCGIAALALLGSTGKCNLNALMVNELCF